MHRIVTGSFPDLAVAARVVSALIAAGYADSEISLLAVPAPAAEWLPPSGVAGSVSAGASWMGALGAMIGPGTVWAWALPDPGTFLVWAPAAGALAGACLGAAACVLIERVARAAARAAAPPAARGTANAEAVTVVIDESRAAAVEAILRHHGAAPFARASARPRAAPPAPALQLAADRP